MISESKKERWKTERKARHQEFAAQEQKKKLRRTLLWSCAIVAVLALAFFIYRKTTSPGKYDSFAQCMSDEGMTMYGTDWCPHCQRQKQLFGKSFAYVTYVNCDIGTACDEAGVQSYPTWAKDGTLFESGVKSLAELAKLSGCPLP